MTRALIVGPRNDLEATVESLHDLKLLHIVDHREGEEGLEIGRPLPAASEASEILVKLRSIASILQLEAPKPPPEEPVPEGDIRERILALELNISEEDAAKKKTQALLQDLNRKVDELRPFALLPLSLSDYRGYDSLEVFVGKVAGEVEGLDAVTLDYEAFSAPGLLAVFVTKPQAAVMRDFLTQRGFSGLPVPEGEGDPRDLLSELLAERDRWEARLEAIEERLNRLRERYADFLSAAKARLEVTVEKAEAPLRFAVTEHTFVVEGWVPTESFAKLEADLGRSPGLFVTELEHDHASQPGGEGSTDDPPVLLRNAKPLRPFEMLVTLFSTPNYREIDPTFILTFTFPIFFGLMVGDAGYGIAWLALGLWLVRICRKEPGRQLFLGITASEPFRDLVIAITWGGFWSLLFGLFFFGEAFGIPFHHAALANSRVALLDWSAILGFNIPLHAQLEKLDQVTDFIVLSIVAAYVHLAIAYVVGFVNDVGHNKRHSVGKIAWLLILTGLFVVMIARSARWPIGPEGRTPYGYLIWTRFLGWFPRDGIIYLSIGFGPSNPIPWVAVGMVVGGIGLLVASEGLLHLMEFFGLMANIVSYARLAAVGVAKAAMAFAFNVIVLETLIFPGLDGGNIVLVILGLVLGFVFHAIVFLLGAVTAAIQAIRLNYVEFFIKFFKGAGRAFRPFGERAKPEV